MSVTIGAQLGTHELLGLLGKGGMGEVYRARDTKLKREVAIKVLPDEFSRDPERLSRFQREAEVLASLNHPNVAAIYSLEQANGSRFLVLELVEGETLAERVKRGPIPIEEALSIAKNICEALEAAHERGIIHRDLKPANVKITPDGKVKVLDFGLAKAFENEPANAALSNSPTLSMAATNAGVILGTAAYMSPEQARGRPVNKATDIWAFGTVLYELLTGKQAFEGEDVTDIIAAVMKTEPDWRQLPEGAPPAIRTLLRRCLRKDRRQRLQDATDARIEIEDGLAWVAEGGAPAGAAAPTVVVPPRRGHVRLAWGVAALMALGMTLALIVAHIASTPVAEKVIRFSVSSPAETHFAGPPTGAVSPDGKRFVFAATDGSGKTLLWMRGLDQLEARALNGTDGAAYPFWSPDSRFIGFFAQAKLKKIESSGGPPQSLCNAPIGRGGTWNNEGVIVFAPWTGAGLQRVSGEGGDPVEVTSIDSSKNETSHRWPFFLPDNRHFLYRAEGGEYAGIYVGSLDSKETKRLGAADANAIFAAPGHVLFVRENTLMARPFDPKRIEWAGEAFQVAERVAPDSGMHLGGFSASANGVLTYWAGASGGTQLTWTDRAGKQLQTINPPGNYRAPTLSPDETKVAFARDGDLWVQDLMRGTVTRLTADPAENNTWPVWSPDGKYIVFTSSREGRSLYRKLSSGTGQEELLLKSIKPVATQWSRDGRFITYFTEGEASIYVLPTSGESKPMPYLVTPFTEAENRFSPDTKFMVYYSTVSGRQEIYVQAFPITGDRWPISTNGGRQPFWRNDGRELFYLTLEGDLMAVDIKTSPTFQVGTPHLLFRARVPTNNARNSYYPTADGKRFLLNQYVESISQPISVIVNWTAALNKK